MQNRLRKGALDKLSAAPDALEAADRRESELWLYERGRALERSRGAPKGVPRASRGP